MRNVAPGVVELAILASVSFMRDAPRPERSGNSNLLAFSASRHLDIVKGMRAVREAPRSFHVPCREGSTSPGAPPDGERNGFAAVDFDHVFHMARCRPTNASLMMARGSSLRGLSEVNTTKSLPRAAASPMSGRLARSRSPPQPNRVTTRADPRRASRTRGPERSDCGGHRRCAHSRRRR